MKLRYFIPIVVALVAMFTGCSENEEAIYLDNIRLSSSYVSLDKDGITPTAVELNASAEWNIVESTVPAWLTISPMSGAAGATTLSFLAEAGGTRTATLKLTCGGQTQEINVIQYAEETEPEIMTVNEALAMIKAGTQPDGAAYVKGTVCRVQEISTSYGNATYFLSDDGSFGDGNWLEVYRGSWFNSEKFTTGDEFSVGDELVVKGVLVDYNGTPEFTTGSEVVAYSPSLIKVDSLDVTELPIEGGVVNATLTCKGSGISVEIPADAQDWLSVVAIDTQNSTVKFKAQPNTGGDRNTTVVFKTMSNGKEYSSTATIAQKGAILEVTVKDFLAAEVGDTQYRLTGVIMELYNTSKGLAGFYIQDYSGKTLIYQPSGFTGTEAKVGDIVTVVGKRGAYNNSPQMTSCLLEEVKSVTEISLAEFLTKPDDANTYYKVTGTIKSLLNNKGQENDLGNLYLTDGTNELYVYGCYSGWGAPKGDAQKYFIRDNGLAVGDELTMIGYKATYNGLIEICGGTCFSFKKAQAANTPGSVNKPFTVPEAIQYINDGGNDEVYVKGKVSKIQNQFDAENGYGTFWISEDGTYSDNDNSKDFEAYRVYWFGAEKKWVEGNAQVAVGDEVVICGKLTKYTNKSGVTTFETSQYKAWIYSLNGKTE